MRPIPVRYGQLRYNGEKMYHGIINVYKEAGFTSFDVVAKLRGILKQKKIGHTGTLDPDAVGVLPVCLGSGTKLCDLLTDKEKEYVAGFRLGITTDTQDISGKVIGERAVTATEAELAAAICSFAGEYDQLPPMYSAIKINGKRLYESARAGQAVERPVRKVEIKEITVLSVALPEAVIRVRCSKGTYIRTLCHDIGEKLGCGATMTDLKRTRSGEFTVEEAYTIDQLTVMVKEDRIREAIRDIDSLFADLPKITIPEEHHKLLQNGNQLPARLLFRFPPPDITDPDSEVRAYSHAGQFYGIYRYHESSDCFRPVKMFFSQ